MPSARPQLARDLAAAALIGVGVCILSWGAWQIDRAAGGIVGGVCILALGLALGFGEVGRVEVEEESAPDLTAVVGEGLTPPDAGPVGVGTGSTSSTLADLLARDAARATRDSQPTNPLPQDVRPTTLTLPANRWIGVNGAVTDEDVSVTQLVERAEQAAVADAAADTG